MRAVPSLTAYCRLTDRAETGSFSEPHTQNASSAWKGDVPLTVNALQMTDSASAGSHSELPRLRTEVTGKKYVTGAMYVGWWKVRNCEIFQTSGNKLRDRP